jgi:hypothetical protein
LSELAAGVVDAKLPIESVDGTVKLDGASSVFTVSTGGETHFTLRPDGQIGQGYVGQANINYAIYQGFGESTQEQLGFLSAPKFDGQPAIRCVSVESQPLFTDVVANKVVHFSAKDDRGGNKAFAGKQTGFLVGPFTKSSTQNIGFDSAVAGVDNFAFLASGTSPSQFNGGIFTPSVRGLADNDASIKLDSNFTVSSGSNNSFVFSAEGSAYGILHTARNHTKSAHATRPFLQTVNGNSYNVRQTLWEYTAIDLTTNDQSNPYLLSDYFSNAISTKVDSYRGFSVGGYDPAGMSATEAIGCFLNVKKPSDGRQWYSILSTGSAPSRFASEIQTPLVRGLDASDAQISLGQQATLKAGDGSEYVPTDSASIATKKTVDEKIWVGSTAQYLAIPIRDILPTTLYCLTD